MTVQRSNTLFFNKRKDTGNDWKFVDRLIREMLYAGGTDLNVYTYDGVFDQYKDVTGGSNRTQVFSGSPATKPYRSPEEAFDDATDSFYESATIPTNISQEYVQIDFGPDSKDKIIINGVGIAGYETGSLPQIINFEGSNDGNTWDALGVLTMSQATTLQRFQVNIIDNAAYRYYRFVAAEATFNNSNWKLQNLELYSEAGATGVQDKFFIENRDRSYSNDPFSLLCWYEIPDKPHDLGYAGFLIPTDQVELTLLISDVKTTLGRAIGTGDIVTLPHIADNSNDQGGPANGVDGRIYEVIDVEVASDGYDRRWRDHLYKVTAVPAKHRQETYDVLGNPSDGFIDLTAPHPLVSQGSDISLNNANDREADNAGEFGFADDDLYGDTNDLFSQDGIPNDGSPYTVGLDFPTNPTVNEYFLNESYEVPRLYQWDGYRWIHKESAVRQSLDSGETQRGSLKKMLSDPNKEPIDKNE